MWLINVGLIICFVQECIDADRVSTKSPICSPNIQQMFFTNISPKNLRFCVGWLQKISCWNALVYGTSMALLGAEQYFAGCLWIDCCGCHQCTYRFEHRLRTLEMRFWIFVLAVSSSETCVFVCLFLHFMPHHFFIGCFINR